jgi:NAD(P)-dependent dehydrogenase (short-subunit alcohol dehydrogenase family)
VEEAERAFFANARPTSIIKRLIDPAEVAAMVTYVCSPLSSATHGAALGSKAALSAAWFNPAFQQEQF